ncbi:hypothetical protein OCK74_08260 [Chitinophagaceae bacterium LB-8]|uniref:Uncharacterized protein n=1 Tax=Paraflavisolibacter caeni TaxID=2982496 RepID=A0A9X2XUG7_9BACT|nr:hypothetical protein [Paraflavisolibacter caeni]MCU7549105.1 hypothetical protein [Paraflavisolibacter caeni]
MKSVIITLFLFSLLTCSCDIRKREQILTQKENELNQKEQELFLKENALQLKEEELLRRSQSLDSLHINVPTDTVFINPEFVGLWTVQMHCIETSCPGSAVGDVKTEQWDISYQNNATIAKVIDDAKVVRIYSGTSTSNSIEMTFQQSNTETNKVTNMIVRLEQTAKKRLEGRREITRGPENCKIIYAVEMEKQ